MVCRSFHYCYGVWGYRVHGVTLISGSKPNLEPEVENEMNVFELLLWGLVAASVVHSLEEYFRGFVQFFPPVIKGFKPTTRIFWSINIVVIMLYAVAASISSYALWLSLAVPAASLINVVLHIGGAFMFQGKRFYSPGLASALLLYMPLSCSAYYIAFTTNTLSQTVLFVSMVIAVIGYAGLIGSLFTIAAFQKIQSQARES
jgi:hypothetical protein